MPYWRLLWLISVSWTLLYAFFSWLWCIHADKCSLFCLLFAIVSFIPVLISGYGDNSSCHACTFWRFMSSACLYNGSGESWELRGKTLSHRGSYSFCSAVDWRFCVGIDCQQNKEMSINERCWTSNTTCITSCNKKRQKQRVNTWSYGQYNC